VPKILTIYSGCVSKLTTSAENL